MKKKGFTVIELVVSVAIISMVTAIFLVNYRSVNRRSDLTMISQKLVTDIRIAQNYSLGLARYGLSGTSNIPSGGWGVYFDLQNYGNNKYIIFADDNANGVYDIGEANVNYGAATMDLPDNIIIQSLSVGYRANVTFLPPDPVTTIKSEVSDHPQLDITIKDLRSNNIKTIRINYLGLVEVID
jgi:prepilin-type N-terminal cleavage/methylation domain-containing protein